MEKIKLTVRKNLKNHLSYDLFRSISKNYTGIKSLKNKDYLKIYLNCWNLIPNFEKYRLLLKKSLIQLQSKQTYMIILETIPKFTNLIHLNLK